MAPSHTKPSKRYSQKYCKQWENNPAFKGWLRPVPAEDTKAYCLYCKKTVLAHKKGLLEHAETNYHKSADQNRSECAKTPKITNFVNQKIYEKRKRAELKIAAFIAEHCSLKSVDHLGEVIKDLDENSKFLSDIKLHRTKCTGLILNVLSPCLLEELMEDVGDSHYSLIVDESTMIDTTKVMCLMIRYFSKKHRKIRTEFYRLLELESGSAEVMTETIVTQLKKDNLQLANLIGIGIDGANAMAGAKNSVSSRLTHIIPHLVTIKCVCHSLHLCAEKACDVLPRNLDTLVKESHAWFSRSTCRNIKYAKLFDIMCEKCPKKIAKLSGTRWLARLDAIETILDQWDVLKLHFAEARLSERGDIGYKAEELYQMYSSIGNKLYLLFLRYSLKKVISVNRLFQSESAEPSKLLQDLNELLYSSLQNIVIPQQLDKASRRELCDYHFQNYLMPVECINFGFDFNLQSKNCNPTELLTIKDRCRNFFIKLAEEIQNRVPKNVSILEKINTFSPKNACQQFKSDITDLAIMFKTVCGNVDETIKEWNLLHRLEIETCVSDEYWARVIELTDASGEGRFKHVSKLAVSLLSLPLSNASVERAFSVANVIKDKLRNRIAIKTADAIMRVRFLLKNGCAKFEPSPKMIKIFDTEHVYKSEFVDEVLNAFAELDE